MYPRAAHFPWLTLGVALIAMLADAAGLAPLLQLDRAAVWPDLWRIATCQLTHWSADHLFWDLLVFLVLGTICECLSRHAFLHTLLLAGLAVPAAVLAFCPQWVYFRGLSGIDSAQLGLLVAKGLIASRRDRDRLSLAMPAAGGALFLAKCLYEMLTHDTLFVSGDEMFGVVPAAHLVGFIAGIACASPRRLPPDPGSGCTRPSPPGNMQLGPTPAVPSAASRCGIAGSSPALLHPPRADRD